MMHRSKKYSIQMVSLKHEIGNIFHADCYQLRQMLDSGEITASDLIKQYSERITSLNVKLNAAAKIFSQEAMRQAHTVRSGPLAGIPISIKENIAIAGEPMAYEGSYPECYKEDSAIVTCLKQAGAIILARSNSPQFALGPETDDLLRGKTLNPLNLRRSPGGSSGGEGALVASGCTAMGIGTDLGGSIRFPAAFCGVVGYKPASGTVSKTGVHPNINHFADSFNAVGSLTRSVRDAMLFQQIVTGQNLNYENEISAKGFRIISPVEFLGRTNDKIICETVNNAKKMLIEAGMMSDGRSAPSKNLYHDFNRIVSDAFEDLIHEKLSDKEGKNFSLLRETFNHIRGKPTIHTNLLQILIGFKFVKPNKQLLQEAITQTQTIRKEYHEFLGTDGIMLLPTVGIFAPRSGGLIARSRVWGVATCMQPTVFCNMLDLPAISLPAKKQRNTDGLVPGITLACKPGNESMLFSIARFLEHKI